MVTAPDSLKPIAGGNDPRVVCRSSQRLSIVLKERGVGGGCAMKLLKRSCCPVTMLAVAT